MKRLNRNFTLIEQIVLIVVSIILLGLIYYLVIAKPVKDGIAAAHAERDGVQLQLDSAILKRDTLDKMQRNLNAIREADGMLGKLESYNNSKKEINFLNDALLKTSSYSLGFEDISRNGDLIRRTAAIQFVVPDYAMARKVLKKLNSCPYRCLIHDIAIGSDNSTEDILEGKITVNVSLTFYETMVDGQEDSGLPKDESIDQQTIDQARQDAIDRGDELMDMSGIE